jgi:uroporphyrinogen-III synthase
MASPASVVVVSGPGTLTGIDRLLRRSGIRVIRIVSSIPRPIPSSAWIQRLDRASRPDTAVVTSRAAVEDGVRVWGRARGPFPPSLQFWAVGPGTAEALRRAGIRRVYRPPTVGGSAVVASLRRTPSRRVVYFRSDVAGPGLARALRRQGHRVVDLVVYRLESPPRLSTRARRGLFRADLLVVTSPSGLMGLQSRLGRGALSRLARSAHLVVLGARSRKAALDLGFRNTSVAPSVTAQRFTHYLLGVLHHART